MTQTTNYDTLTHQLVQQKIGITAAELHGFLSGMLAGGNEDESWQPLAQDMLNNGQPIAAPLWEQITSLYNQTKQQFSGDDFEFKLLLSEQSLFDEIDDLIGWVNHFLLGIGLVQPHLTQIKGDVGEAIYDLRQIAQLGYDENDDQKELGFAFEEIKEYVRMAAVLCHDQFSFKESVTAPTIH